jgi:hypothetical protein
MTDKANQYSELLKKVERVAEAKKQRIESGGTRNSSGSTSKVKDRMSSGESVKGGGARKADPTYSDPLGQVPDRPKTSAQVKPPEDIFDDVELDDELLPE